MTFSSINWNRIEDPIDKQVWDRLTSNFWLPEKIPVANDLPVWRKMDPALKDLTVKVFTGLTMLDTLQSQVGAVSLMADAVTPHEEAVYTNIAFMESVHAKSYSTIFSTLCSTEEIDEAFRWADNNTFLQQKAEIFLDAYNEWDAYGRKVASVLLESFLFYSGFYLPLRLASMGKLVNTADIIRLIIRDEAVHGFYIGYKAKQARKYVLDDKAQELVDGLVRNLYELECGYAASLYDQVGWTADVKRFIRYNANKAMANLGLDPVFDEESTQVSAAVLAALDPGATETHDFFSGAGSSYVIGRAEDMTDDDWA